MGSKVLRDFEINIFNLGLKSHEFDFDFGNAFFDAFENSMVGKGSGSCHLIMDKSETMMNLNFRIKGEIELECDRTLRPFMHPIDVEEEIIIKFGDDNYSLSESIFVIRKDTPSINVAENIYEFISLAVPMKKLHPDVVDEEQPDLIYSEQDEGETKEKTTDPRWDILKKLKEK